MSEEPAQPSQSLTPPTAPTARHNGRCDHCGYSLVGLDFEGVCPECGRRYTEQSATRLKPWPSALSICMRLGWPMMGLLLAGVATASRSDALILVGVLGIWAMMVALPLNSYFNVRWMLKRSLPEQTRTRGPVATMRAIGTTLCVLVLMVFVGGPLVIGVGCLLILSGSSMR